MNILKGLSGVFLATLVCTSCLTPKDDTIYNPACGEGYYILTPPISSACRINGPEVFGVRPGHPFLYTIPVTGDRPLSIRAEGLPQGLTLNSKTGMITGVIKDKSIRNYPVKLTATNEKSTATKAFEIKVGEEICLTPPMGWSSWICTKKDVSQDKVMANVKAMVRLGLNNYGYHYVNIDDAWQGNIRGGDYNSIQPNLEKFSDVKHMVSDLHAMGLKVGIYSTPWISSYAGFIGGSSNAKEGTWDSSMLLDFKIKTIEGKASRLGSYKFDKNEAKQWAAWGIDYMKYDWNPNDSASIVRMAKALRESGRDIVFSISNSCPMSEGILCSKAVQVFRTGGDIRARWDSDNGAHINLCDNWNHHNQWLKEGFSGAPGHIPDPDFMMVGLQKYGSQDSMTVDEIYHHVSSYVLWGAPLLLSTQLDKLSPFEMNLLTNVEMLAIDQDRLARPARLVYRANGIEVLAKDLANGEKAFGVFNFNEQATDATLDWTTLGLTKPKYLRDVWRQKDIGLYTHQFKVKVRRHGCVVIRTRKK